MSKNALYFFNIINGDLLICHTKIELHMKRKVQVYTLASNRLQK